MATKKSAATKAAKPDTTEVKSPAKTAAKKVAAKKSGDTGSAAGTAPVKAAGSGSASATPVKKSAKPTHEDIAVQAYLQWEQEGRQHGHDEKHWHRAEQELSH